MTTSERYLKKVKVFQIWRSLINLLDVSSDPWYVVVWCNFFVINVYVYIFKYKFLDGRTEWYFILKMNNFGYLSLVNYERIINTNGLQFCSLKQNTKCGTIKTKKGFRAISNKLWTNVWMDTIWYFAKYIFIYYL